MIEKLVFTFTCLLVLCITTCNLYGDHKITELIMSGVDPIEAKCAIRSDTARLLCAKAMDR